MGERQVIVYDFNTLVDFKKFGFSRFNKESTYDHAITLSDWPELSTESTKEQVSFGITSEELAHVILADTSLWTDESEKHNSNELFDLVVNNAEKVGSRHKITADIFFSKSKKVQNL